MAERLMHVYLLGYGIGVVSGWLIKLWWDLGKVKNNTKTKTIDQYQPTKNKGECIEMNKEDYDKDFMDKLHNLVHDQKSYNINFRDRFNSWEEAMQFLELEHLEVVDSLELVTIRIGAVLQALRAKEHESVPIFMEYIAEECEHLAQEVLHVGAVALKANEQLHNEKAPTDCNK